VSTDNFAHMMPLSAPFVGLKYNPSKYMPAKTAPLMYGVTSGGTPFRWHPHVEDVGHQLIVGPNGSGKSVWIATNIAQWFRYPKGQVYAFDKKGSLYTLCKAMGGSYYDIAVSQMCPLQDLETDFDRDSGFAVAPANSRVE
jgi:type IV secretory pathway VirB4 component